MSGCLIFYKCPCDGTNLIYASIYFFGPAILAMVLGIMSQGFNNMLYSELIILSLDWLIKSLDPIG